MTPVKLIAAVSVWFLIVAYVGAMLAIATAGG